MSNLILEEEKEIIEKEFLNYSYEGERESSRKAYKEELIDLIKNEYDYGQVVRFDLCARLLRYNLDDELEKIKFRNMMGTIKSILIKEGKILKGVSGVGYYILKPKEISAHVYNTHIKRSARTLDAAEKILDIVDESELSPERKEELEDIRELNSQLQEAMEAVKSKSRYMSRKERYAKLED